VVVRDNHIQIIIYMYEFNFQSISSLSIASGWRIVNYLVVNTVSTTTFPWHGMVSNVLLLMFPSVQSLTSKIVAGIVLQSEKRTSTSRFDRTVLGELCAMQTAPVDAITPEMKRMTSSYLT